VALERRIAELEEELEDWKVEKKKIMKNHKVVMRNRDRREIVMVVFVCALMYAGLAMISKSYVYSSHYAE
jgi:hypothetical protein